MVRGAFSRVILGRKHNYIKAAGAGVRILHKPSPPPPPPLLLHYYSRSFTVSPTNHSHISKGLSNESDSEPGSIYDYLIPASPHRYGYLAKPLVQIFLAQIYITDFGHQSKRPCEIYGSIQAIEEEGVTLNVYDRDEAHPEPMFFNHGILTLSSPKRSSISCNVHFDTTLDVCIKDKSQDIVLVEGKHILHSKDEEIEDSCDKLINAVV